jgi:hypothetical protein
VGVFWWREFDRIRDLLMRVAAGNDKLQEAIMTQTEQYTADTAALKTAVDANTAVLGSVGALVASDTKTIADQAAQIAALKLGNPALDFTGLEASTAALAKNNATAAGLLPAAVPAAA